MNSEENKLSRKAYLDSLYSYYPDKDLSDLPDLDEYWRYTTYYDEEHKMDVSERPTLAHGQHQKWIYPILHSDFTSEGTNCGNSVTCNNYHTQFRKFEVKSACLYFELYSKCAFIE